MNKCINTQFVALPLVLFMVSWWRHQMETFSALLAICAGNSPVPGEFLAQRPVTRSFDVYFDLRPNKRLSKQWWGWWFETQSWPLWRHSNGCKYQTSPVIWPIDACTSLTSLLIEHTDMLHVMKQSFTYIWHVGELVHAVLCQYPWLKMTENATRWGVQ